MAKRKSKRNPVAEVLARDALGGVDGAALSPKFDALSTLLADCFKDILDCNTARKCHDRVRAALRDLEEL